MNPSESPSSSRSSGFESMQVAVQNRTAQVVVMGLGAVGLALVRLLLDAGFSVLGVDPGEGIVGTLRAGR
ncbi:MAG: UDP-N-acetyl-D-mannosaminuronate dehydrogenase, partial [Planctomycetota bacterium]